MEIDKKKISANWSIVSSHLDDVAYALYVNYCDNLSVGNGYKMTLVDQDTFIALRMWVRRDKVGGMEEWDKFYDEGKMILRNEKIKKILYATNR